MIPPDRGIRTGRMLCQIGQADTEPEHQRKFFGL